MINTGDFDIMGESEKMLKHPSDPSRDLDWRSPVPSRILAQKQRFWSKVTKTPSCWIWNAGKTGDGYGAFWLNGKTLPAHRVSWLFQHGSDSIPEHLIVDHICRNRACVRLDHLRLLDNRENVLCGVGPSAANARKTYCKNGHELSGSNLYIQGARRRCRKCMRASQDDWQKANREKVLAANRNRAAAYYAKNRDEINRLRRERRGND